MNPYDVVIAQKSARDQLAELHLKYRQIGRGEAISRADHKITSALKSNPDGGMPVPGTDLRTVTVLPLQATYQIRGSQVRIVRYDEKLG